MLRLLFICLIAAGKTAIFRAVCARKGLEKKEDRVVWAISSATAIVPAVVAAGLAICCLPFGYAMANAPIKGSPFEVFLGLMISLPLWVAPFVTGGCVLAGWGVLKATATSRPWYTLVTGYLAVLAFEYVATLGAASCFMPKQ